jgi:CO/xanthine dehydrogenase FAD-binding subunit
VVPLKITSLSSLELHSPTDLVDAVKFLEFADKSVVVIANGTDLIPRMRKRQIAPSVLLDISSFQDDLRYIRQSDGVVRMGALTTLTDVLESPIFKDRLSILHEAAGLFGAPQVRNVATVGGNICSASSSEDLIPVFMALGAKLKLISAEGERIIPLKDFVIGKRVTAMKPSEILVEIHFGYPEEHSWTGFEKLGRRNMLILSLVNEALFLRLEDDLLTVRSARVALNRVAGRIPALAEKTEDFLAGRKLSEETIAQAQRVLASELALTSDFRGSASYRTEVAQVFLKRLLQRCYGKIRSRA